MKDISLGQTSILTGNPMRKQLYPPFSKLFGFHKKCPQDYKKMHLQNISDISGKSSKLGFTLTYIEINYTTYT